MRSAVSKERHIKAVVALTLILTMLGFVLPGKSFAEDGTTSLKERSVQFIYSCTDCKGNPYTEESEYYSSSDLSYPTSYPVWMYTCDSGHVVRVNADGADNTAFIYTSTNTNVLDIDSAGNVTLRKPGKAEIKVTIPADNTYRECIVYLGVTVDIHDGWDGLSPVHYAGRSAFMGLDLETTDEPQQLVVPLRPGARATFAVDNPNVAIVDQDGWVTPLAPGTAQLTINVDDDGGRYKAGFFYETVTVTGEDIRSSQEITGDLGPFTIDWHDGLALDLHAETDLYYYIVSSGTNIDTTVDQNGFVKPTGKGIIRIKVLAEQSKDYKPAEAIINITARDYAEEEAAAKKAAEEAALKAEIAKAKSLKRPTLKAVALGGRKVKLTWSKVKNAGGYAVYIRYPGTKKYVKAVTRNATVKSVTHKGLSKGRAYYYKVRAFKKVKGKTYYGPFSKVRKVRVK